MATDIAFAVGVLALVGKRSPLSLRIFLLTLAIVDDLGAILVIALFYSRGLAPAWLALAMMVVVVIVVLQRLKVRSMVPYAVCAGVLWLAVFSSGVHATIAGVVLGLLTPTRPFRPPEVVTPAASVHLQDIADRVADGIADEDEQTRLLEVSRLVNEAVSPLARLEARLHGWSSLVVLPLFALANAGVTLGGSAIGNAFGTGVTIGVVAGLVVGKPVGILLAVYAAVRLRLGRLPAGVGWLEIAGAGMLAGIGFTVALFVTGLAFADPALQDSAKVGVLIASLLAGVLGSAALWARDASRGDTTPRPPTPPAAGAPEREVAPRA
jgi:NhaA family Na+:H+ antiporter